MINFLDIAAPETPGDSSLLNPIVVVSIVVILVIIIAILAVIVKKEDK